MNNEQLVPIGHICMYHEVEYSFINLLQEYGLIEITTIEKAQYIRPEQMKDLERWIRLHYDLEINAEGIDAVAHLLQKIDKLQREITTLENRLQHYENEEDL